MKKFIPLIVILATLTSCREDDDYISEENVNNVSMVSKKESNKDFVKEVEEAKNDSVSYHIDETDPPKNGEHWKYRN